MTRSEIKQWAKEKIKGNIWTVLPALLIAGLLTNITIGSYSYNAEDGSMTYGYQVGWLLYFVQVGLTYFMVKFINDQKPQLSDVFHFFNDFGRDLLANLLQGIFIFLWSLLFIIPGIMKAYAYALVPYLLADDNYHDMGVRDLLKMSEEMMSGHRADLFWLQLSYIGWHILAIFTLGLLEIWVAPYQKTAETKFLYMVKDEYEKAHGKKEAKEEKEEKETKKEEKADSKFCAECGTKIDQDVAFCPECGAKI